MEKTKNRVSIPMDRTTYERIYKARKISEILFNKEFVSIAEFIDWIIKKTLSEYMEKTPKDKLLLYFDRYFDTIASDKMVEEEEEEKK